MLKPLRVGRSVIGQLVGLVILMGSANAFGAVLALDAFSRGQLDSLGQVISASPTADYGMGNIGPNIYSGYFIFDLTDISIPITTAKLRIYNPADGFVTNSADESLALYTASADSSGHLSALGSSGAGGRTYTAADQGSFAEIDLGAKFLIEANGRTSPFVAVWGKVGSRDNDLATQEYIFRYSNGTPASNTQLLLTMTVIPEPISVSLLAPACILLLRRKTPVLPRPRKG